MSVCACACVCRGAEGRERELGFPKAWTVNPQSARIPRNRVQQGGNSPTKPRPLLTNTHTYDTRQLVTEASVMVRWLKLVSWEG